MTEPSVIAAFIVVVGGIASAWLVRRWQSRDPVTQESAAITIAERNVAMATNLSTTQAVELTRLAVVIAEHDKQLGEIKGRVQCLERSLSTAIAYIESLLRDMKRKRLRPSKSVPAALRDQVAPHLMDGWDE